MGPLDISGGQMKKAEIKDLIEKWVAELEEKNGFDPTDGDDQAKLYGNAMAVDYGKYSALRTVLDQFT
jgi:hypothetical protein